MNALVTLASEFAIRSELNSTKRANNQLRTKINPCVVNDDTKRLFVALSGHEIPRVQIYIYTHKRKQHNINME